MEITESPPNCVRSSGLAKTAGRSYEAPFLLGRSPILRGRGLVKFSSEIQFASVGASYVITFDIYELFLPIMILLVLRILSEAE